MIGTGIGITERRPPGGAPAPTFNTIVIAGDSNTSTMPSVDDGSWAWQWLATRPETIENRAQGSRSVGTTANLNDNGNTLFGNVAENLAYGPDLITYMIGSNDWSVDGGTTDAQYRTNLTGLFDAYKSAAPALKIAWSPPPPYNPTGTPHAAKAWFDAQRASLMADARNPAVWGQWADYYTPLGEHPDFADPATAAPLFGDSVHYSAAGDDLVEAVAVAAFGTILDPTRQNSNTLYDAAWLTDETDLAVGGTITRRMIVSGLKWTGHSGGVSVTGAGSPSVKVGGVAGPAAYAYNGDVVDLTLTLSGSYETATSVDLTIGGETRTLSFTTAANVAPVSYVHGDVVGNGASSTTTNLSGLTFLDGLAVVILRAAESGASTPLLNGGAMTLRQREVEAFTGAIELWEAPVAAGSGHALAITYASSIVDRVVSYGTITDGLFVSSASNSPASEADPHLTPSVAVPANGLAIAGFLEYGAPADAATTVGSGTTLIDAARAEQFGEIHGLVVAGRATTGAASFSYKFGSFPRLIAVYGAA